MTKSGSYCKFVKGAIRKICFLFSSFLFTGRVGFTIMSVSVNLPLLPLLVYYVLTLSLDISHKTVFPLYICLLSGCPLVTTPEAAVDVPAPVCCGAHTVHHIWQCHDFAYSSFNNGSHTAAIYSFYIAGQSFLMKVKQRTPLKAFLSRKHVFALPSTGSGKSLHKRHGSLGSLRGR